MAKIANMRNTDAEITKLCAVMPIPINNIALPIALLWLELDQHCANLLFNSLIIFAVEHARVHISLKAYTTAAFEGSLVVHDTLRQ